MRGEKPRDERSKLERVMRERCWLVFSPRTCFGDTHKHFGLIMGISSTQHIMVAVNATSQVTKRQRYARAMQFPEETLVLLNASQRAGIFGKPTLIDCNCARRVRYRAIESWVRRRWVRPVLNSHGEELFASDELMWQIRTGILLSPVVPLEYKRVAWRNEM